MFHLLKIGDLLEIKTKPQRDTDLLYLWIMQMDAKESKHASPKRWTLLEIREEEEVILVEHSISGERNLYPMSGRALKAAHERGEFLEIGTVSVVYPLPFLFDYPGPGASRKK